MAGRSNLQQAVPITFGYKMATVLAAFERHKAAPEGIARRACWSANSAAPPARCPRSAAAASRRKPN